MRRTSSLQALSHDHHHGLVASVRLRRILEAGSFDEAAAFVAALWTDELASHFASEETHLLPALRALHADVLARRMCREHRRLHALAGREARHAPSPETLRQFGEQLRAHIRFEERVVFPYLERRLPDDALQHLSTQLEDA